MWMARVEGTSRKERQKRSRSSDSLSTSKSQDSLGEESGEKGKEEAKHETPITKLREDDRGLLNFDKLRMLYQFVSEIQRKQGAMYEFEEDVELSGLLEHIPLLSDEELFEQSLICEPRAKA